MFDLPYPPPPCMVCGKTCTARTYMPQPWTPEQLAYQRREKKFMPVVIEPKDEPKPLRRGKQGIAARDGKEGLLF